MSEGPLSFTFKILSGNRGVTSVATGKQKLPATTLYIVSTNRSAVTTVSSPTHSRKKRADR